MTLGQLQYIGLLSSLSQSSSHSPKDWRYFLSNLGSLLFDKSSSFIDTVLILNNLSKFSSLEIISENSSLVLPISFSLTNSLSPSVHSMLSCIM